MGREISRGKNIFKKKMKCLVYTSVSDVINKFVTMKIIFGNRNKSGKIKYLSLKKKTAAEKKETKIKLI